MLAFIKTLEQDRRHGYERTQYLIRLTAIRTAFVKGWGRGYRRTVGQYNKDGL